MIKLFALQNNKSCCKILKRYKKHGGVKTLSLYEEKGHSINTKGQSLGRGFVILSLANIIVKVMSLLFVPLSKHLLGGYAGYSVYNSAYQVFAFVYVLTTAGFPTAISKLVTELTSVGNRKQATQAFKMARAFMVIIGLTLSVFMIVFSKPIARVMNNEESWLGIATLAPTIFICALLSAYRGYLQGLKNMTPTAVSQVAEQIAHIIVSVLLIVCLRSKGIVWAVTGATIGTTVGAAVALLVVIKYYKEARQEQKVLYAGEDLRNVKRLADNQLVRLLIVYGLPITINSAIQNAGNMIDTSIMKGRLLDAGFSENVSKILHGMMGATRSVINVPAALITALCISLLPVMAGLYAQGKFSEAKQKADYAVKLCYIVAIPIAVAMCVFAKPLYVMMFFGDGSILLCLMSFSVILMGIVHLQSSIMQSVNDLVSAMINMFICVVIKAVLNFVLISIPSINIYGAVIATYVSYAVPLVLNHLCLVKRRNIKLKLLSTALLPFLCSGLMLVGAVPAYLFMNWLFGLFMNYYFTQTLSLVSAAVVGIVVYAFSMKKTGGMDSEDFALILPAKIRKKLKL